MLNVLNAFAALLIRFLIACLALRLSNDLRIEVYMTSAKTLEEAFAEISTYEDIQPLSSAVLVNSFNKTVLPTPRKPYSNWLLADRPIVRRLTAMSNADSSWSLPTKAGGGSPAPAL